MRRLFLALACCAACASASAQVFLNEVFINPPGSLDDTREFIELWGTPGMKLDGYAVALVNGGLEKFYPLGSIPPAPAIIPEIDELFSLDGLSLGRNGVLVIGIGTASNYPTLLSDSNFALWTNLWNGLLDVPGKLNNDGSTTFLLVRHRPGTTQADPNNPGGLRWGKDIDPDYELITPVIDPQDGQPKDQFGNGGLDKGQTDGMSGFTLDLKGESTPGNITDDLEIVDEVSWEQDRGWEYDMDNRRVDVGSSSNGLPERRVHALDDPQGINPDALSRVDYRTKGAGWTPQGGGAGQMANGKNWPDTATEQWVRGESVTGTGGQGGAPQMFYDNSANANPDSIQPYVTNVPIWLADGNAPDYNFGASFTYQIMAGRVNPLAVSFIPGDVNRDGVCDAADIVKTAAVFGDNDWIFSNSFPTAPQGDAGDPATQTRPWDVNGTGDNGIEASDLQWTLNFQGNTNGRVIGVQYDSTTAATTGVKLNPNAGVGCTVTISVNIPSGHTLSTLVVGDTVELTVLAQVTSGANNSAGEQNGVMQFVHDLAISTGGVLKVTNAQTLGVFSKTRATLESLQGSGGDQGVKQINGYATSFTQGVGSSAQMYRVTLQAIGAGNANISLAPAAMPKFAASTPRGLKVGHTDNNGNPATAAYPTPLTATVTADPCAGALVGDANCDGVVDFFDIDAMVACILSGGVSCCNPCTTDCNDDGIIDFFDIDSCVNCILAGGC